MEHPPQHPPENGSNATVDIRTPDEKPTGFDTIYPRLKDVRKHALKEMHKRGGEASTTILKADDGGQIKEGSFDLHINWLKGKRRDGEPHQWWPDGAGPLIVMDRKEDRKYGPTKIYALTEYGERFVETLLEMESTLESIDPHVLRRDLDRHANRVDMLLAEINEAGERASAVDGLEERVTSVKEQVEQNEQHIHIILDHLGIGREKRPGGIAGD